MGSWCPLLVAVTPVTPCPCPCPCTGIQHRRNQASLRLYGEPGHVVVSAFEPTDALLPAAAAAAGGQRSTGSRPHSRQQHTDRQQQQQQRGQQRQPAALADLSVQQQLSRVQASVRRHLAAQVGISSTYRGAVEAFDTPSLQVCVLWCVCVWGGETGAPAALQKSSSSVIWCLLYIAVQNTEVCVLQNAIECTAQCVVQTVVQCTAAVVQHTAGASCYDGCIPLSAQHIP
jgi:hypothetical protein